MTSATRGRPARGRPSRWTGVRLAGVLLAGSALLLAGCGDDGDGAADGDGTTPTGTPSASPTGEPVTSDVWFLVDTGARAGFRLVREPTALPGADPAVEAVEAMVAGPVDPDYATTWNAGTEVLGVTETDDAVEVDLSAEARTANVGSEGAALMIQQLVYTVTDALDDDEAAVQLLIEGEPAGELWGAVTWDEPVTRADPLDVRLLVQIDSPQEGATVSSRFEVEGEAAVFEATVHWRILDANQSVVHEDTTSTQEGQTFSPFSFRDRLTGGVYTIEVSEDDPSGGEAPGEPMTDTKQVTVE